MEEKTKKTKTEFNPLKKEIVEVRYIRSTSQMYNSNPDSPVDGGLAETASITYAVPYKDGMLTAILTPEEQAFFEKQFNLEPGTMNNMRVNDNYWTTYGKGYINRVTLDKSTKRFDLSKPKDYIEVAILKANTEHICPSQEAYETARKPSYRFVMSYEDALSKSAGVTADVKLENFEYYAKFKEDADMLRTILYLYEKRKTSPNTKLDLLKAKVVNYIETASKHINNILSDTLLEQKKVVIIGVEKGIVSERNGFYYISENGQKLSEDYEEPNLNNAAKYLADVTNQELYFSLMNKIK